ncbi:MAG: acyl-CoA/acyl-ACP dehydrogenase [candidate division WOR-3 bacterium]|nr:acyl-CoA/acyl-ACP dehydrogenase [candidate division WOR-3 bacterium]
MDFSLSEDAEMIRQTVHEFVRRDLLPVEPKFLNVRTREERESIARDATKKIKEMGLYSAGVPEEFGGGGLGLIETCLIAEELSKTIIPVDWGDFTPILYECPENLKSDYLLPVVAGEKIYALAFREPEHFTTADEMSVTALPDGDNYILNGVKLLSRPDFDFCLVFAQTPNGITCFLIDRDAPGTEIDFGSEPAQLVLSDCRITSEKIIGKPGAALYLGQKWFPMARISRSAAILGVCSRILETSAQYLRDWKSMNEPISTRKEFQRTIGAMAANIEALRWLVYRTAWLAGHAATINFESMLLKLCAQNTLEDTVNSSVRIHGGTIPPARHWLVKASQESEAVDMLRLAVSNEVINRYAT